MPVTKKELNGPDPMLEAFKKKKITVDYLAGKLKSEMNARETKAQIPKGEKEFAYSKPMIAWDVRQKARQDAHKLRGDYPNEKLEHTGTIVFESNVPEPDPLPEEEDDT